MHRIPIQQPDELAAVLKRVVQHSGSQRKAAALLKISQETLNRFVRGG